MRARKQAGRLVCYVAVLLTFGCANISGSFPTIVSSRGVKVSKPLNTWKEIRDRNVVMQKFDYSCGASALATLMNYYFGDPVSEREILEDILNTLKAEAIENRKIMGLTLLDLKEFAVRRGYRAAGVKLKLSALPKLQGPVLVYMETKEYRHFAILRGVKEDRVLLADPSRGNIRMPVYAFAEQWPGVMLVLGKPGFGMPSEYPLKIKEKSPLRNEMQSARRAVYQGF